MRRRLLIAARSMVPHRTPGYQRMTWDLAAALRGRGWDVTVLTTPVAGRAREFGVEGLRVVTVASSGATWPDQADRLWAKDAPVVARDLGLDSFDAVLGIGPAGQVLRPKGPLSVFHWRDGLAHDFASTPAGGRSLAVARLPRAWLGRLARELDYLRRADAVVVGASKARDLLRRWPYRAVTSCRPAVVRSGVPTRRFRRDAQAGREWRERKGIPEGAPLVVTVSRFEHGKGLLDSVAAFRAFLHTHRDARYVLVGTGPAHAAVRRRVLDLNLGSRVDFLGRVPDLHVVRWLQAADLFLFLPRRSEARPPVNVLEALACGTPVVATTKALDPDEPYPHLHAVPPGRPAAAALAMGEIWKKRDALDMPPLPKAWRLGTTAKGLDLVLRGRRA